MGRAQVMELVEVGEIGTQVKRFALLLVNGNQNVPPTGNLTGPLRDR